MVILELHPPLTVLPSVAIALLLRFLSAAPPGKRQRCGVRPTGASTARLEALEYCAGRSASLAALQKSSRGAILTHQIF
jgi:hypothetical protein